MKVLSLRMPKIWRIAACFGALLAVFILGGMPGTYRPASAGHGWAYFSNFLHQPLYAGVGLSFLLALGRSSDRMREWILAAAFALGVGILDEIHQAHTVGRSSSLWDLGSDAYGGFCAAYFAHLSQSPRWLVHHALPLGLLLSLGLAWNCLPSFAPEIPLPSLR